MRIPTVQGAQGFAAEVVGGSAERDGGAERVQSWQVEIEPGCVFEGEPAGDEIVRTVVAVELGLQAGDRQRLAPESRYRFFQLVGLGPVLGIEDDQEFPARVGQADIARSRLGFWRSRRHHHHADPVRRGQRAQLGDGFEIVFFEQHLHVEPVARIVEAGQRGEQLTHDRGFAIEWHQHGVDRQLIIDQRQQLRFAHRQSVAAQQPGQHRQHLDADDQRVERQQRDARSAEELLRVEPPPQRQPSGNRRIAQPLAQAPGPFSVGLREVEYRFQALG